MSTFWEIIASNAVVATILAILAAGLGRAWRNAAAVHVLWVVVLLKLFTPPLITAGVPFALIASPIAAGDELHEAIGDSPVHDQAGPADVVVAAGPRGATSALDPRRASGIRPLGTAFRESWSASTILAALWICGACG